MLLPEWAKESPPYNVAKLAAISKANGYTTYAIDANIESFNAAKSWNLDFDPWHFTRDFKWRKDEYFKDIHPHLEPLLLTYLDQIEKINPTIVGFTLYYCNEAPTIWLATKIKERLPHIIIAAGGPHCRDINYTFPPVIDYIVSGEGEQLLLDILQEVDSGHIPTEQKRLIADAGRLNLDMFPSPDYSYFTFSNYERNGINSEISRGCIAKCTFCSETHFWKFRERSADKLLSEIEDIYKKYNIEKVHFIDSLVNGDLKELIYFAQGLIDRDIKVSWTGFARCDKRMDLDYLTTIAKSGAWGFALGCESGSNKVLESINKKVTRKEMEENFANSKKAGLYHSTMWITGFPTEEIQDFYETLVTLWRIRNLGVGSMSVSSSQIGNDSITAINPDRFNLSEVQYLERPIAKDFSNSKLHRLIRTKSFLILVHLFTNHFKLFHGQNRTTMSKLYNLQWPEQPLKEIEIEIFDFNIIRTGLGTFADSLFNEIWPLLRIFWRVLGAFQIEIFTNPELDAAEFGVESTSNLTIVHKFNIDNSGNWGADFAINYIQPEDSWRHPYWNYRPTSVEAQRVVKLERITTPYEDRVKKTEEVLEQVKDLNLSFNYHYLGTGKWE